MIQANVGPQAFFFFFLSLINSRTSPPGLFKDLKGQVTQINNDTWRQPHTVHTATSHYSEVSQRCRGLKETQNPEFQT